MSELGLQAAIQRAAAQTVPNAAIPDARQLGAPGIARVPVPPRDANEAPVRPRKAAAPLQHPRGMEMGSSPLAPEPLSNAYAGVDGITGNDPDEQSSSGAAASQASGSGDAESSSTAQRAAIQARAGHAQLPSSAGLVAYAQTPRGETVYLEQSRWNNHIVPSHITDPPQARGKRTTTWWPVQHSATGSPSMTSDQVVGVVMDAVRDGHWQNAPRGTLLSVYDLPQDQASQYGVSEVKVSTAPDGRILSAYPSAGTNVLAVRETGPGDTAAAAAQPGTRSSDKRPVFTSSLPATRFG